MKNYFYLLFFYWEQSVLLKLKKSKLSLRHQQM